MQQLFIEVRRLRKLYRLKTQEKTIIKWLLRNLQPRAVKRNVESILQQRTRKGYRASKRLSAFHRLLMKVAKTFHRSIRLGILKRKDAVERRGKEGRR